MVHPANHLESSFIPAVDHLRLGVCPDCAFDLVWGAQWVDPAPLQLLLPSRTRECDQHEIGAVSCFFGRSVCGRFDWLIEWLLDWLQCMRLSRWCGNPFFVIDILRLRRFFPMIFFGGDPRFFYRTWWEAGMRVLIEPLTFEMNFRVILVLAEAWLDFPILTLASSLGHVYVDGA